MKKRLILGAALALTAGAVAGTSWAIVSGRGGDTPQPERHNVSAVADRGIVCFGHVDVEHGVTGLAPLVAGRVVEVPVREGEALAAGAALLRLDDRSAPAHVAQARAAPAPR